MNREPTMSSGDYVWDRSGPPDPAVQHLEAALSKYRHSGREPDLVIGPHAEIRNAAETPAPRTIAVKPASARWMPIAAMIMLALIAARLARPTEKPWLKIASRDGAPLVGQRHAGERLHIGQWLSTDAASSAEIEVAEIGTVSIKPNSKLRIVNTGEHSHLLDMPYGHIHAFITAPPRVFVVDTPAARAVDMGCEYTLEVGEDGAGILRVTLGHVLLEGHGRLSDVPMNGGTCKVRRGLGPGTPYFDDASTQLVAAVERFDFAGGAEEDLKVILAEARPRDALSLWHLLRRTARNQRELVYARLAELKPPPERITKRAIMGLDTGALDAWFEHMRPF